MPVLWLHIRSPISYDSEHVLTDINMGFKYNLNATKTSILIQNPSTSAIQDVAAMLVELTFIG